MAGDEPDKTSSWRWAGMASEPATSRTRPRGSWQTRNLEQVDNQVAASDDGC